MFGLLQPNGAHGLVMNAGERFRVRLSNAVQEPALIHWHGLTPPNDQDGVPGVTQPPLAPGERHDYDFAVALPGTNWMHSHHVLQEQSLMAAPLIVRDPKDAARDEQEVVILLHDFTFQLPDEILSKLSKGMSHDHGAMAGGPRISRATTCRRCRGMGRAWTSTTCRTTRSWPTTGRSTIRRSCAWTRASACGCASSTRPPPPTS